VDLSKEEIEKRRDELHKMLTERREKPPKKPKKERTWHTAVTEEGAKIVEQIKQKQKEAKRA
jgi:hypothetical protein